MRNQKGSADPRIVFVALAVIVIIVALLSLEMDHFSDGHFFEQTFGFPQSSVNGTTRPLLQPQVTSELNAFFDHYQTIADNCKRSARLDGYRDPQAVRECTDLLSAQASTLERAVRLAAKAGFETGNRPETPDSAGAPR